MIYMKMREQGIITSKKHVRALMNKMKLVSKQMTSVLFNTRTRNYVFRKNLVCQKFKADLPNVLWVSDVTFIRAGDVFHSLCVIIDVFSRKVFAHKISLNNDTALVLATFQEAFAARGNPSGITFHSDQGKNYTIRLTLFAIVYGKTGCISLFPTRQRHMTMRSQRHSFLY